MTVWLAGIVPSLLASALGLAPGEHSAWIGPLRTLALVTASVVVLLSLMPEALAGLGIGALFVFISALYTPLVMERARPDSEATLQLAIGGLALHQGVDGLQIGALQSSLGLTGAIAIGLHGSPLVLAALLATKRHMGIRAAAISAAALVGGLVAGMVFGHAVPDAVVETFEPYLVAAASGLLLHVLAHDLGSDLPETPQQRGLDLLIAVGGTLGTVWMLDGGALHELHSGHDHPGFANALLDLYVDSALPMLLVIVGVVAARRFTGVGPPVTWLEAFDETCLRVSSWVIVAVILLAYIVAVVETPMPKPVEWLTDHEHAAFTWVWATALGLLLLRSLSRISLRQRLVQMVGTHAHHHHHHH